MTTETKTERETSADQNGSILTKRQRLKFGPKHAKIDGRAVIIKADVRHDDECGNGHNSFSITGEYKEPKQSWDNASGGCIHDEIAQAFPELAPFIKWHLTSTDGPMHYIANTVYLAGDLDYNGSRKGEACGWDLFLRFTGLPLLWRGRNTDRFLKWLCEMGPAAGDCEVLRIDHGQDEHNYKFAPKFTLGGFADKWHECPFDNEAEALAFVESLKLGFEIVKLPTAWSEGKARELDAARRAAVWPEATDEQLSAEPEELKRMLVERHASLMVEFRAAVESLGLVY